MQKILMLGLFSLLAVFPCRAEVDAATPVNTESKNLGELMSRCLTSYNWSSWNMWRFDVYARMQEFVLIGDVNNYFAFRADTPGYVHVIDDEVVAEFPEVNKISNIDPSCDGNCPVNHAKRVSWFKRRCQMFD